jgi:ATP-dependent helicase/nuclease subunit A
VSAHPAIPDRDARRRAVTDFEANLVVLAGAGTGKTSLLVERVLNAIGSGHVDLRELAAITFTEKAAAEMRLRVAEGLAALLSAARGEREPAVDDPAARSLAWLVGDAKQDRDAIGRRALEALERMDRARIQTLLAFASELLRDHPLEAGVDPGFRIDTGEQADVLRREQWERFLARELGAEAPRRELWHRVLSTIELRDVADAAAQLSEFGVPLELLASGAAPPDPHELLGREARRLADALDELLGRATGLTDSQSARLPPLVSALRTFAGEGLAAFRAAADHPTLRLVFDRERPKSGTKLSGVSKEELENAVKSAIGFAKSLRKVDEQATRDLVEATAPFALEFREELSRRGWVNFDGLLVLARDLLRDHPDVRSTLKRRLRMLLVDELQDTDPLQYEIVLYLAEREDEAARDAWAARLRPGALFVVGDPKQSIYRFRGADYTALGRVVERIAATDAPLVLSANFRSVPGVVDPINRLFETATSGVWKASEYQPIYESIEAVRADQTDAARVEVWTVDTGPDDLIEARRRQEGEYLAAAIEHEVRTQGAAYRDFAVLFRTFASIRHYLRPLRERGIPFVVDGGKDFLKRPEVSQSLAILQALAQPADPIALLGYLRSPEGGVSDVELARYAAAGLPWNWRIAPRLDGFVARRGEFPLVAQRLEELGALHEAIRDLPADAAVRQVLSRARLVPLAGATYEGAQRVANLRKFAAAAAGLARDGRMSLEDVIRHIQEAGLADFEADSPLADDDADAVRITSIHKMKGLETRRLFLPDLGRVDRPPNPPRVAVRRVQRGGGRANALALRIDDVNNAAWLLHEIERDLHEEAEETRVLYVALTRARDRLVLLGARPGRNSPRETRWYRALSAWGYDVAAPPEDDALLFDGLVRHRIVSPTRADRPALVAVPARETAAVAGWNEATRALVAAAKTPFRPPSALEEEAETARAGSDDDRLARPRSRNLGKAVGLVVHRALEAWDAADPETLGRGAKRLAAEVAREEAVDPARLRAEVREVLESFLASELASLRARLDVLGREIPLLSPSADGPAWRGSIDLLYRDADGGVVVADYKTDRDEGDDVLAARYGGQLAIYADAVRRGLGLGALPRRELWLLRSGRRLVLEDDASPGPTAEGPPRQLSLW